MTERRRQPIYARGPSFLALALVVVGGMSQTLWIIVPVVVVAFGLLFFDAVDQILTRRGL